MSDYIIIRNSVEQAAHLLAPETHHGKKFKVVFQQGYRRGYRKTGAMNETISGTIDKAVGAIYFEWQGTIRTRQALTSAEVTDGYGTMAELQAYFLLNNPTGSPSDVITLVDHDDVAHTGFLVGDHAPEPIITQLTGNYALYFIPIQFRQKEAVA